MPTITPPDDLWPFWQQTLESLGAIDAAVEVTHQSPRTDGPSLSWLTFRSWEHAPIHAYLLHWPDATPRPLVVHTHGYGEQVEPKWQWAARGVHVLGYDTRGFGRSTTSLPEVDARGWILSGIDSAHSSILRGACCDYIRAHEVACQLLADKISRTIFYGYSFGAAMALVGAALTRRADLLAVGVPTFGWMAGRRRYVLTGSGREINRAIRAEPTLEEPIMATLNYFDSCHFAAEIRCPTLIGFGLRDVVVPPQTVRPIIERLTTRHRIREFPVSHSNDPREALWQQFENEWLEIATSDTPPERHPILA